MVGAVGTKGALGMTVGANKGRGAREAGRARANFGVSRLCGGAVRRGTSWMTTAGVESRTGSRRSPSQYKPTKRLFADREMTMAAAHRHVADFDLEAPTTAITLTSREAYTAI